MTPTAHIVPGAAAVITQAVIHPDLEADRLCPRLLLPSLSF